MTIACDDAFFCYNELTLTFVVEAWKSYQHEVMMLHSVICMGKVPAQEPITTEGKVLDQTHDLL